MKSSIKNRVVIYVNRNWNVFMNFKKKKLIVYLFYFQIDYPEINSLSTPSTTPLTSTAYHQRSSSLATPVHSSLNQQSQLTAVIKAPNRGGSYRGSLPYRHSVGNATAQSPNNIGLINNMDHHNIRHAIQSGVNIVCDDNNVSVRVIESGMVIVNGNYIFSLAEIDQTYIKSAIEVLIPVIPVRHTVDQTQ